MSFLSPPIRWGVLFYWKGFLWISLVGCNVISAISFLVLLHPFEYPFLFFLNLAWEYSFLPSFFRFQDKDYSKWFFRTNQVPNRYVGWYFQDYVFFLLLSSLSVFEDYAVTRNKEGVQTVQDRGQKQA